MVSNDQAFRLSQLGPALRRRWLAASAAFFGVFAISVAVAWLWPPTYSSSGTILIEQQELPADLVRSTVSTYASQRVQVISQRVMTTDNLTGIIARYNLYADLRGRKPREEIIAKMRHAVNLQMISADVIDPRDGRPTKATIAFSVAFRDRSAQRAAEVANELVSLYLQQNIEQRQKSAHDAVAFLDGEQARLAGEIDALQAKLATFKAKHENELPEENQLNLTLFHRMEDDIRDTDTQLQSLEQQRLFLESQLAVINPTAQIYASTGERVQSPADLLKQVRAEYARATALYAPDHPDVVRLKRELQGLEASVAADDSKSLDTSANDARRQLEQAQRDLAAARQRYSEDHPDVIRLRRLVDSLQRQVAAAQATPAGPLGAAAQSAAAAPDGLESKPDPGADNPPYVQLRTQLEANLAQQQALRGKREDLQRREEDYERRVAHTPAVERDYMEIVRDLNSAQQQYSDIRRRQMEADVSDNLETERKGERFTLIEPPLVAEVPASPNRPLICVLGLVLALGAVVGLIALLENADGSVRGRHDLQQLLSVPPLAVIPMMLTQADHARLRRRLRVTVGGLFAALTLAVLAVHLLYRPLDVIWSVAMRQLGLMT